MTRWPSPEWICRRSLLGVDVGSSEDRAFWTGFLRSLVKRGLRGVRLIISDAHEGLKQAIATVLTGATWQRCRAHFMRNLLATVPAGAREPIAAVVRTIFAQPDHATAMTQLRKVADGLRARFPRAAALLEEAAEDILAYRHLPIEHQRQLHSTSPLERLNKEIKRRSNVVGIFPTPRAVIRLVGVILIEQDDEWAVADRRYFSAEFMKQLTTPALPATGTGDSGGNRVARPPTNNRPTTGVKNLQQRENFNHLTGHYLDGQRTLFHRVRRSKVSASVFTSPWTIIKGTALTRSRSRLSV